MIHFIHALGVQAFQKSFRAFAVESRVGCLDREEEPVATRPLESVEVEQRMVRHRQPVQSQHAQNRGNRSTENRQLERDGDKRGPTVQWSAADVHWVMFDRREPLHEKSTDAPYDASHQGEERNTAVMKTECFIQRSE